MTGRTADLSPMVIFELSVPPSQQREHTGSMSFLSDVACDSHHVNAGQDGHESVRNEDESHSGQFEARGLIIETGE